MSRPILQRLVRRAELYGTECLWQAAERDLRLDAENLAALALQLRRLDPAWRLSRAERDRLVTGLLDAGWPDARIMKAAGVGRTALWGLNTQQIRGETVRFSRSGHNGTAGPKTGSTGLRRAPSGLHADGGREQAGT
jgi:hypothetical protein